MPKPWFEDRNVIAFRKGNALWIPFIMASENRRMKDIVGELVQKSGLHTVHFTSVMSLTLAKKLRNATFERHWFKEAKDFILCAKVQWE